MHKTEREQVRIDAMLLAYGEGVRDSDELLERAREAEKKWRKKRGRASEKRFSELSREIPEVKEIHPASIKEDERGIDYWVKLNDPEIPGILEEVPVQIKSSPTGTQEFKRRRKFSDLKGLVMVLNVGPKITRSGFIGQFERELTRVTKKVYRIFFRADSN